MIRMFDAPLATLTGLSCPSAVLARALDART
jgi:hypothetical protein